MTVSNPLLFLPSPRSLQIVEEVVTKLNISKLWVKYHTQEDAYDMARDFFLKQSKFTHLIIHPDDLLVTQKHIDQLTKDIELYPDIVISGYCINTINDNWKEQNDTCISYYLPFDPPRQADYESYRFISAEHVNNLLECEYEIRNDLMYNPKGIIQISHSGFALQAIPRKIIESVPFRTDYGCCVDSCFSLDLAKEKINQYADLKIKSMHIRTTKEDLLVGKKNELVVFER